MKKKKEIKRFDLHKPFNPSDIKTLSEVELEFLCEDIRENIIVNCAKNGGHLASSLGATDLIVAIHHFFNLPKDKVIFDVGHQSYAHKILSGRTLEKLRKKMEYLAFKIAMNRFLIHTKPDILDFNFFGNGYGFSKRHSWRRLSCYRRNW